MKPLVFLVIAYVCATAPCRLPALEGTFYTDSPVIRICLELHASVKIYFSLDSYLSPGVRKVGHM